MNPCILVYDVGTSSLKAVLYEKDGNIIAKKSQFYEFSTPRDGWAEIDPEKWWESLQSVTGELGKELEEHDCSLADIKGIAVTGQMHSAVLLDKDGKPAADSILWLDRRAAAETEELQERFGLPPYKLNSSYTLPKLYWQSKHQPDILAKVDKILWPKDYIRFRLTGEKVTDYTEGIGSSLIDWETWEWAEGRIEACGMSRDVLPEIMPQEKLYTLTGDVVKLLGFSPDCKVLVGCGDIAALLGGAPNRPGRLVYSLGSSSMYFTELEGEGKEENGLYTLNISGYTLFGGVTSTSGASLNWAYEELWGGEDTIPFRDMISQVLTEGSKTDSLLFFPFLAGERSPFWSDRIEGSFEGLKLSHGKQHITRAVMEGVAFSIRYILDLMEKSGVSIDELALAAGGAKTPGWPELIASATRKNVAIYNAEETVTTVLFSILAGELGYGEFRDILASQMASPRMVSGDEEESRRYDALYETYCSYLDRKLEMYGIKE